MSVPLPSELFIAMQYIHDNHSLISPPIRSKLDFLALTLLLNHSNEPEKIEKLALILDNNPEETPQLRGLGIEVMVKIYIDTVDVLFPNADIKLRSMTKNGNLFVRSQTLKVWGERSLSLNYGLHTLIIRKTSPRKPDKEIDLLTYSLHWLGEIKNRFCFSLETKTPKNHYKAFWIGVIDLETAREWYEAIRLSMSGCYVSSWIEQRNKMDRLKRELSPRSSETKNIKTLKQARLSEEKHDRPPKIPLFHSQSAENSFIFDFSSSQDFRNPENSPTFKMLNEFPSTSFSSLPPPSFSSSLPPKPPPAPFLLLRIRKKRPFLFPSSFFPSSHHPPSSSPPSSCSSSRPPSPSSSPSYSSSPLLYSPPPLPLGSLLPPLLPIMRKRIRKRKEQREEERVRKQKVEGSTVKVSSSRMLSIGKEGIVYGGITEGERRREEEEDEDDGRRINDFQSVFVLERKEMEDVAGWRKVFGSRQNRLYRCKKDGRFKWFLRFEENPRLIIDFFANPKNLEILAKNRRPYKTSIDSANLAKNILLFSVISLPSSSYFPSSSLPPPPSYSSFPPSSSSSSSFAPSSLLRRYFENENYFIIKDHPLYPLSLLQSCSKPSFHLPKSSFFPLDPSLPLPSRTFIINKKDGLVTIEMGGGVEWLPSQRGYKEIKSFIRKRKRIFRNLEFLDQRREDEEEEEVGIGREGERRKDQGKRQAREERVGWRTKSEEGRKVIIPKELSKKNNSKALRPSKPKLQKQVTVQESFINNEFEIEIPKHKGLISFVNNPLSSFIQPPSSSPSSFFLPPPSIPERRWSIGGEKMEELGGGRRRRGICRNGRNRGGRGEVGGGEGKGKGDEKRECEEEGFFIWETEFIQKGGSCGLNTWNYLDWKDLYRPETLFEFIAKGLGKSFRWLKGLGGDFNQNLRNVLLFVLCLMKELVWVSRPLKCLEKETYGRIEEGRKKGRGRREEEGKRQEEEKKEEEEDGKRNIRDEENGIRKEKEEFSRIDREEIYMERLDGDEEQVLVFVKGRNYELKMEFGEGRKEEEKKKEEGWRKEKEEGRQKEEGKGGKKEVGGEWRTEEEGGGGRRKEAEGRKGKTKVQGAGHIKSLTFLLEGGRRQIKIKCMPKWYIVASRRNWREVQWTGNLKASTEEDGLLMDLEFDGNSFFGRILNESVNKREVGKVYGNWLGEIKVNGVSIRSKEEAKKDKRKKIEGLLGTVAKGSSLFCSAQREEDNEVRMMEGCGVKDSRNREDVLLMREGRWKEAREMRERMEVREEVARVRKWKGEGWLI